MLESYGGVSIHSLEEALFLAKQYDGSARDTRVRAPPPGRRPRCLLTRSRLTEEVLHESVDSRTESLLGLRELGPPDLVHLLKQSPRNQSKQVRSPAPPPPRPS
ncbi:hypothetical protein IMZ48_36945 [Candidatus Bathyarchaeota archaeon]|nr:hypothetical protein [Candidatus Bathyarchaeota archaeon]